MTTASESFRINSPKVVHDNIDGEVVIVNLEKGYYYSLVKAGADVWAGMERGISRGDILEQIFQQYNGTREVIENSINSLIEELLHQELVVIDQTNGAKSTNSSATQTKTQEKLSFEVPTLEKYTDMEDLLLLDPIHEVDEMGWPSAK